MAYVEGFLTPVPKAKLQAYKKLARKSAAVFMKYGALSVTECLADDVKPGKLTSFPQAVKLKAGETVVLSWIVFPSKAVRNKAFKLCMKDPFMADFDWKSAPFDGKRMIFGGFKTIVEV
jgi:uncharacterized protein YbaA (DUF1428 family)